MAQKTIRATNVQMKASQNNEEISTKVDSKIIGNAQMPSEKKLNLGAKFERSKTPMHKIESLTPAMTGLNKYKMVKVPVIATNE